MVIPSAWVDAQKLTVEWQVPNEVVAWKREVLRASTNEASNLMSPRAKFEHFGDEFLRIERAGIQLRTPEAFRSKRRVHRV
jgi:hypothetical protein